MPLFPYESRPARAALPAACAPYLQRTCTALRVTMLLALLACRRPDAAARERIMERDQLRREVAGFRSLVKLPPGKVMDREHEVLVSVSDTLLRDMLTATFPLTIDLRNSTTLTLSAARVAFRANVAQVELIGQVHRTRYPRIAAAIALRGALDGFKIDSLHALRARISIDDIALDTPSGTPDAFDPLVIDALQIIVERSLPELTASLPSVAVPVRLDQAMTLPGFGPEGTLSVPASTAPMSVQASHVIAFQNRLWIVLHIELGAFASPVVAAAP